MKIYLSKTIKDLYFYDAVVMISFDISKTISNTGLSYIIYCICKGVNDIEELSKNLIKKFGLKDDLENIRDTILNQTVHNADLYEFFTTNINDATLSPKFHGVWGERYPEILHIEMTGACNFSCEHCYKNAEHHGKYVETDFLVKKIYNRFADIIPIIHFTGGEPTLHRDFDKLVNMFSEKYTLQLTTNGSQIVSYPIEIFKKFQSIDISLYGLSCDEYKANTGVGVAFERVKAGLYKLNKANIKFRVTLVLNNENWKQMEDYIRFAIDIGADNIGFASPMDSGKLIEETTDKWHLSKTVKKEIYIKFRELQQKYGSEINITEWERTNYSSMWKTYLPDESLRCGAGKNTWWMSEKYTFRPCSFLPEEYINIDYDTWLQYITKKKDINWKQARYSLEAYATDHNLAITDICGIFSTQKERR